LQITVKQRTSGSLLITQHPTGRQHSCFTTLTDLSSLLFKELNEELFTHECISRFHIPFILLPANKIQFKIKC